MITTRAPDGANNITKALIQFCSQATMSAKVLESGELPLAVNAAPLIGSFPEFLDKISFVFRFKLAAVLAGGDLIRRIFCLILFT